MITKWLRDSGLVVNESKTEILMCGRGHLSGDPLGALGPLASHSRPFVKNLSVFFDSSFTFDKQISLVVKSSFFPVETVGKDEGLSFS